MNRRIVSIAVALIAICIIASGSVWYFSVPRGIPILEATLDVYASNVAEKPISRLLFGQFSEHLGTMYEVFGNNIYRGMWAQILDNPGFELSSFFGVECVGLEEVAYRWSKYGEGNVSYAIVPDCVGSGTSQMIEVSSLKTSRVGIQQSNCLPLHREDEYDLSLWLKGDIARLIVSLGTLDTIVDEVTFEGITPEWTEYTAKFVVATDEIEGTSTRLFLSLVLDEPGTLMVDHCLLFPTDNMEGFDADVVRLTQESNLSILRWPGGIFASYYHWKDGVGQVKNRPMRLNRAWDTEENNHVGTDEFIAFCRLVGAEPLICINAYTGTSEEAAEWVEYCNGDLNTTYGRLRAENGHPEPYNVKYWEVGNELFSLSSSEYAERYEHYHDAMYNVDPTIEFIACGGWNYGEWDQMLLEWNGETVHSLSRHYLKGGSVNYQDKETYLSLIAYTYWLRDRWEYEKEELSTYTSDPKIAITELQVFGQTGSSINRHETTIEAIYYSGIINSAIKSGGFVEMITHSALVNHGGGLNKICEVVYADPVYYVEKIYATQPGIWPVNIAVDSLTFSVTELPGLPAVDDVPYIDAVALLNDAGNILSLIVTNRHPETSIEATIRLHDLDTKESVATKALDSPSYTSRNEWFQPDIVTLVEGEATITNEELTYALPPYSITLFLFKADD